jgi:hypothetical protein
VRIIEPDAVPDLDELTDAEQRALRHMDGRSLHAIFVDERNAVSALMAKGLARGLGGHRYTATANGRAVARRLAVSAQDAILGPEERTDAREPVGTAKSPVAHGEA